ncbi:hypothetical protein BS47DRAFT_1389979 [Hydnum rufescens UP504]|uniref:PB1 domain-containing protein n=1 Tax=Hydnum rufescens UP504 TaxID=1448309 RepID=A0A9P6B6G6_9AGAM|nr:hypothetical protein BS47DRAFT_1389979 [Hydnum rufescens UP504]
MSCTIKLDHNGHTRRLTHPKPPTWEWLAAKVSQLYKIPRDDVAINRGNQLSYVDPEEDQVTLSTQEELEDYFTNLHCQGETVRRVTISIPPVTQMVDEDEVARDVDHMTEGNPLMSLKKSPPRLEKNKGKEVVLDGCPATTANVRGAQFIRGSEGDPGVLGATIGRMETVMPPPAQAAVEDPPLPSCVPITQVNALAASLSDPSNPTVASANRSDSGNAADDVTPLLQAFSAAFVTNPEFTEGVRRIIRSAPDPTYLERDYAAQIANQAISRAVSAAEASIRAPDGSIRGVNEAFEGVFSALSSDLNGTPTGDTFGLPARYSHRPRPDGPPYHRRGRWPRPIQSYLQSLGPPFPHRGFPRRPPPPLPPFETVFPGESSSTSPPPYGP